MSESKDNSQNLHSAALNKQSKNGGVQHKKLSTYEGNLQVKKTLKQQAKQLLLKGCYLIAANKYLKLIDLGIKEFSARQQAIIYLNCGICFQFMSEGNKKNFIEALNYMKTALSADKTYKKTYYRLIQLLRDHGYYQTALSLVPDTVNNKQIELLLNEVKQLYLKQSDFSRMLQKFKTKQVNPENVKIMCLKLEKAIHTLVENHKDGKQSSDEQVSANIERLNEQICLFYVLVGNFQTGKSKDLQDSQNRKNSMQEFTLFLGGLFGIRFQDKNKMVLIDLLIQSTLNYYRGQLSKFLDSKVQFKKKSLNLPSNSMFLSNNQFVKSTNRKVFFESQLKLVKFARLIDTNIELFGKTFIYLSNQAYETSKKLINGQKMIEKPENILYDNKLVHKFLISNSISVEQIITQGLRMEDPSQQLLSVYLYGGHPDYLFKYVTKQELNFLKGILLEQCQKFSAIYESSTIHPVWLQGLHDILFSINSLLNLILGMLQVYSARQSRNVGIIVNELTEVTQLSHLIYIQHWELHSQNQRLKAENTKQQTNSKEELTKIPCYGFKYSYQQLLDYFERQKDNFIALYLIQKIFQFIQKQPIALKNQKDKPNSEKEQDKVVYKQRIIQTCINKLSYYRQKIKQLSQQKTKSNSVYKQMYLITLCIVLKLDIKRDIQIDQSIAIKEVYRDVVSDISLQVLLLLLINKPSVVTYYLQNQRDITKLLIHFLSKPLIQQIEPFRTLLNVIYILICDFQNDQEHYFAKKLGVTQQEVHQVRKLQKQTVNEKYAETLIKLKTKFKTQISLQWLDILNQLCRLVRVTLKMQSYCTIKLCKIVYAIAEVNHSKLYSSQIIEFMLQARNVKEPTSSFQFNIKETACKFFQIICKKCNVQLFEYKHLQLIVDSLLWLIKNSEHELTYFQSLLGLVNLSTMSVRLPIEEIQKCLYEQNSYIVHAGVCVMNNILIYNEELLQDQEKNTKIKNRLSDLVCKYVQFYRDQITLFESQLSESDYSHPKKIYNSLISLATVLKLDKLEQLQTWEKAKRYVKILQNNQSPELMFKLAIYHSIQGKLPQNWHHQLEKELEMLKKSEPQKFFKLAQLI